MKKSFGIYQYLDARYNHENAIQTDHYAILYFRPLVLHGAK